MSRLGEDISLHEVAASVQLLTGHFSTAFKQSLGVTPQAWLRRQRIERAKTLLHDPNLDLVQIAMIFGLCQPEFIRRCVQERDRPYTNAMASARSDLTISVTLGPSIFYSRAFTSYW